MELKLMHKLAYHWQTEKMLHGEAGCLEAWLLRADEILSSTVN